jgi:hypothetical protein
MLERTKAFLKFCKVATGLVIFTPVVLIIKADEYRKTYTEQTRKRARALLLVVYTFCSYLL